MKIAYEDWKPRGEAIRLVEIANESCERLAEQGYDLTLRQLYYQFVARDYIPNTEWSYKNLGSIINDARLAGCSTGTTSRTAPGISRAPPLRQPR